MSKSQVFLFICLVFTAGIFLSSFIKFHLIILCAGLIVGILLISVFWQRPEGKSPHTIASGELRGRSASYGAGKKLVVAGFCILFLVLGIWRHQSIELRIMNNELRKYNDLNREITLIGIVSAEPDVREKSQRLTIKLGNIEGKVLATTWRYPEYRYGDKLKVVGRLESPSEDIDGFNYRNYLKKEGIYSIMSWPKIELLEKNLGNPIYEVLFSFKNRFKETTRQFISPPQGGILEALFFGDEENISKEWKDKLNFTGTRHITAVSGMNIAIIAFLILNSLLFFGLWRQQAFYLTIILLILYILMIGAPSSAVRAGIMGGILLLAQYLGRMSQAVRAVVFAAAFMLVLNPLLLRLDVGFQLSFLAVLGIIYFQPIFSTYFKKIPDPKIFPLRMTLATTIAAQIFTFPILVYNFGYIPLLSPITNILIVPFLAPITILIFIFGISGMIFSGLGWILSWPLWLFLTYITKIIDWFSRLPLTSLVLEDVHWIWLIISYLILGILIWRLNEKQKLKFLNY